MLPMERSAWWIESDTASIESDPVSATLIVRLGLAMNALDNQGQLVPAITLLHERSPVRMRTVFTALLTYAAITREGLNILTGTGGKRGEFERVLALARKGDVSPATVKKVRRLCAGTHRASALLTTTRNQLAFHWDPDVLRASVEEFATNESVIWVESDGELLIQRFAIEVVANVLFPHVPGITAEAAQGRVTRALRDIDDGGTTLSLLFHAAIKGHLHEIGAVHRTHKAAEGEHAE
jgi:hypothetical protein